MNLKDHFITGLIGGLVAPVIAFSIYTKIRLPEETLMTVVLHIRELGILSTIISLSVFVNLLVFFIFLWIKADQSAKGVLASTFLYAFIVVILKLT